MLATKAVLVCTALSLDITAKRPSFENPVTLSGAQGLLWAFDSLYAMVNGGPGTGLHRLTDSDGDGELDRDEHIVKIDGGGEHGPHAVILSPDGKSLYICAGNHTKLPGKIDGSMIPQNWSEDLLLPRRWDANGHAAGILAPGGWICSVNPDGSNVVVRSIGFAISTTLRQCRW